MDVKVLDRSFINRASISSVYDMAHPRIMRIAFGMSVLRTTLRGFGKFKSIDFVHSVTVFFVSRAKILRIKSFVVSITVESNAGRVCGMMISACVHGYTRPVGLEVHIPTVRSLQVREFELNSEAIACNDRQILTLATSSNWTAHRDMMNERFLWCTVTLRYLYPAHIQ